MECSQAVLMLMLLVPCEQSGGQTPETLVGDRLEPPPILHAAPAADRLQPAEAVLSAGADNATSTTDAESVVKPVPE